jgi:hypothetical protein
MLLVTVALVTAALMAASALPVLADPAPPVGPHQHYLSTPNGVQRVGPNICTALSEEHLNASRQGFYNFHHNVHVNPTHPTDVSAVGCTPP